jgi:tetratricopeptide (TPR) repeat protein
LWIALLYGGGLCGSFLYDDVSHIQENPALASWGQTLHSFATGESFAHDLSEGGGTAYRPLLWLSLGIDRHVWNLNPCGFHLTNLILHWATGFLFFLLLRRMKVPQIFSAAACLLWLGLPINAEAVAWISGRTYPLMCVFLLLALLLAQSYLAKNTALTLCLFAAASIGALLSNEQGIVLLPLTMLLVYFLPRGPHRRWLTLALVGVGIDGVYLAARKIIHAQTPIGAASLSAIGTVFFKYLLWMLAPIHMSVERSTDFPARGFSATAVATLAAMLCLLFFAYWLRNKIPLAAFGLLWTVIALLPFSGIVPVYQGMAERYAYLASFGLVVAIVALVRNSEGRTRSVLLSIVLVWGLWSAWRLRLRVFDWTDPILLYQSSLEATPRSTKLLYNLGAAYEAQGDFSRAAESYRQTLALNPAYVPAIVETGNIDQQTGNLAEAEQEYRRAIAIDPSDENIYNNLGALFLQEGKIDDAIRKLSQAVAMSPSDPTAYYDLGAAYQKAGDDQRAIQMYTKALALKPDDADTLRNLKMLLPAGK